ncbi:MAG: uroporphyrinogen decarboxylase family protein [Verrucomicrobiia bacterium]
MSSVAKLAILEQELVVISSKELAGRALAGLPVPRVPVGPLAVHYCAKVSGITVRDYTRSARKLAESVICYAERFNPDAVWVSADTWVSAEAMGARVGAVDENQPWAGIGEPLVQTRADVDRIPPPDPSRHGRYPLMLDALQRVVEALGRDFYIVACFDQYPFSLAAALLGIENLMIKLHEEPQLIEAVMERALEYGLAYGRAMADCGADMLSGGDSPAGLVGPHAYAAIPWAFEKRLIRELKSKTGKTVSLHICGRAGPLLGRMAQTGADVLELDWQVDIAKACKIVGPEVAIWGNLDPVAVLAHGTPADVRDAAAAVIAAVRASGHRRFVLSSGCTLAMETPAENLEAMFAVARESSVFSDSPRTR